MLLKFELTMPNNNAWNGVDTGNRGAHFAFRKVDKQIAESLDGKNFYYNFGDGWGANVYVSKGKKCKTEGFRGYDWMVDEIIKYGDIKNVQERRFRNRLNDAFSSFIRGFVEANGAIETTYEYQSESFRAIFHNVMLDELKK